MMSIPPAVIRYRAVSMELAAYLDGRYVEMHILADTGKTIAIACDNDSIFAIQRHIEEIGRECPEIATWNRDGSCHESDQRSYEVAAPEGWPATSQGTVTTATAAP
jgi:hypothetical protein